MHLPVLLAVFLSAAMATAQVAGPPVRYPTASAGGRELSFFDCNGDGIVDAVFVSLTAITFLPGDGFGGFGSPVSSPAPLFSGFLAVGDLNGDHRPDAVTTRLLPTALDLGIAYGGATGFAAPVTLPITVPLTYPRIVDVSGDGRPDIVASAPGFPVLVIFRNDGGGVFTALAVGIPASAVGLAVADIDGDHRPDLLLACDQPAEVVYLHNLGGSNFGIAWASGLAAPGQGVLVGDLDGDRRLDLVVWDQFGTGITTFTGTANGTFVQHGYYVLPGTADSLLLYDHDGDGVLDLVAASSVGVIVARGDGAGGFLPATVVYVDPNGQSAIAAADLDGDGRLELCYLDGLGRLAVLSDAAALPAGLQPFGSGTASCRGRIGQGAIGMPQVGNLAFTLRGTNVPPLDFGLQLLSLGADLPGSDPFGLGLRLHIDLGSVVSSLVLSDAVGVTRKALPVPASPGLAGLPLAVQSAWIAQRVYGDNCSLSPLGLVSSRGLLIIVQP